MEDSLKIDPNEGDGQPVVDAIVRQKIRILNVLLAHKLTDITIQRALEHATVAGKLWIVRRLIVRGVRSECIEKAIFWCGVHGKTRIMKFLCDNLFVSSVAIRNALDQAAKFGNFEVVRFILRNREGDLNEVIVNAALQNVCYGYHPDHHPDLPRRLKTVRIFVKHGNVGNHGLERAANVANKFGHRDLEEFINSIILQNR